MVNWYSIRVPRPSNKERIVFATNGAKTTEQMEKNEVGDKKQKLIKVNQRPKCKS